MRKVFKTGDADHERLRRQVSTYISLLNPPRINVFLDKIPLLLGFIDRIYHGTKEFEIKMKKMKEIQNVLHFSPKDLAFHTKAHSSSIIFIGTTYRNVLVPEIYLGQVQDIHFIDLGIKVCEANPDVMISYSRFVELWQVIMEKVYDFENLYKTSKKIKEIGTACSGFSYCYSSHI